MLFARGYEAKGRQRIFAHMGMDQKGNFGVHFAHRAVSRKRHLHEITDAAHVHEHLVRSFFGEPSAQLANHRSPVLPPFLRLSTRTRVCGYSREKGTTPLRLGSKLRNALDTQPCLTNSLNSD